VIYNLVFCCFYTVTDYSCVSVFFAGCILHQENISFRYCQWSSLTLSAISVARLTGLTEPAEDQDASHSDVLVGSWLTSRTHSRRDSGPLFSLAENLWTYSSSTRKLTTGKVESRPATMGIYHKTSKYNESSDRLVTSKFLAEDVCLSYRIRNHLFCHNF
jgi:hypothetical protein